MVMVSGSSGPGSHCIVFLGKDTEFTLTVPPPRCVSVGDLVRQNNGANPALDVRTTHSGRSSKTPSCYRNQEKPKFVIVKKAS